MGEFQTQGAVLRWYGTPFGRCKDEPRFDDRNTPKLTHDLDFVFVFSAGGEVRLFDSANLIHILVPILGRCFCI
jgi:hypothetical protein